MHKVLRAVTLGRIGGSSGSSSSAAAMQAQQESQAAAQAAQNSEQAAAKANQGDANLDALLSADTMTAAGTTLTNPRGLTTDIDALERNTVLGG